MTRDDASGEEGEKSARRGRGGNTGSRHASGFTLLELLVSIAIITVLVSLLLPAINSAVAMARSRKCQAGQRAVAFDFSIFADDSLHGYRGTDRGPLFKLSTFQDAQYQVQDFWDWGEVDEVVMPDSNGHDPMRCPEVIGPISLLRGRHAYEGAVGPVERLSYGFNIRLHQAEVMGQNNRPQARFVSLGSWVMDHSQVPLMWDIDAVTAAERGVNPLLSGPALDSPSVFANDRYWFPGRRHHGKANYVIMDGHVVETATPMAHGWEWGYTPPAR